MFRIGVKKENSGSFPCYSMYDFFSPLSIFQISTDIFCRVDLMYFSYTFQRILVCLADRMWLLWVREASVTSWHHLMLKRCIYIYVLQWAVISWVIPLVPQEYIFNNSYVIWSIEKNKKLLYETMVFSGKLVVVLVELVCCQWYIHMHFQFESSQKNKTKPEN